MSAYGVTRVEGIDKTEEVAVRILEMAESREVKVIDTAPAYGEAEEVIGRHGREFTVHTKLAKGVGAIESMRRSMKVLNRPKIDLLYLHDVDQLNVRPRETIAELEQCLDEGAERVGVSVYDIESVEEILSYGVVGAIQLPLNPLDRRFVDVLPRIHDAGCACIARSIFLQGVLLEDPKNLRPEVSHLGDQVREFRRLCEKEGVTALEGCLAWTRAQVLLEGSIIGVQTSYELAEIMDAWTRVSQIDLDIDRLGSIAMVENDAVDPRRWRR